MAQVVFDTPLTVQNDTVTVSALVDGQRITVQCWASALQQLPNKAARQQYVAGLLKAAAGGNTTAGPDLSGTVVV